MENSPEYVSIALDRGYDVEIDVWYFDGFFLGHDFPQYKVNVNFLQNEKLWCHAKNIDAILKMKDYNIHYFWHEKDKITLTSKNYVWAYPSRSYPDFSIAVLPEKNDSDVRNCYGICSDEIIKYKLLYD